MMQTGIAGDSHLLDKMLPAATPNALPETGAIAIFCYENEIPSFVADELDRLYGSLYSSLAQIAGRTGLDGVSTYVVRKGGEFATILLFRLLLDRVDVLNEVIRIPEEDIARFATHIFAEYRGVNVISFHAVNTDGRDLRRFPLPLQRFNCLEDVVLSLPPSVDEYTNRLGKATRKTIKYNLNKLTRNHPSFRYDVFTKDAILEQHVLDIVRFNRNRMAGKNKISIIDDHRVTQILNMVRLYGCVGVATVDGRVCAGSIAYRIGPHDFMEVSGHAAEFDDYRMGTLCCYLAICECITRGGRECHFQWGEDEYKFRFLGVRRNLDHLVIYRSLWHMLLNAGFAAGTACKGYWREAKVCLRELERKDVFVLRQMIRAARTILRRPVAVAANDHAEADG